MNFTTTPNDPLIVPADADITSQVPSTGYMYIGTVIPWSNLPVGASLIGHAGDTDFMFALGVPKPSLTAAYGVLYAAPDDGTNNYGEVFIFGLGSSVPYFPFLTFRGTTVTAYTFTDQTTAAKPGGGFFFHPYAGGSLPALVGVPMGSVYRDIINNGSTISSGAGLQTVANISFTGDVKGRIYRILARFACYSGTTGDVYNALLTVNGTQVDQSDTMVQHAANSDVHMLECEYTFTQPSDGATTTILLQTNLISGTGPLTVKGYGSAPFRLYVDDLGMNLS